MWDFNLDLSKIWQQYGIKGIIAVILVVGFFRIVKNKWFLNLWYRFSDKIIEALMKRNIDTNKGPILTESDILNHDIFNYIDFWVYSKIPTLKFSTEYRTVVFRKYLTIYLRCYKKAISDFIRSGDYMTMDHSTLPKSFLDVITKIIYDYESQSREAGIPEVVIMKMKVKNNDAISLIMDLIDNITNSRFYESDKNFLKVYSMLNITLSILENTISNSETICNSINGELKGNSMDGKVEVD